MRTFRCLYLIILFLSTFGGRVYSQSFNTVRQQLNFMFSEIDKSRIPTGFLSDYAIDLVDLAKYDGTLLVDSNYINLSIYKDILYSLYSASVQPINSTNMVSSIMETFTTPSNASVAKISVINHTYNRIRANALTDQLISFDGDKVYDNYQDGVWQNPYETKDLFAFATNTDMFTEGVVYFYVPNNLVVSNQNYTMQFWLDAGDGRGFRSISSTTPAVAIYTTTGEKELILKVTTLDNRVLLSHSRIFVVSNIDTPNNVDSNQKHFVKTIVYGGESLSARASIHLANGHSEITKPLIYAEGFDPHIFKKVFNNGYDDNDVVQTGYSDINDIDSLFNASSCGGIYDLVYVDWGNSLADIRGNAQLLTEIIKEVNSIKRAGGSTEKNIVMGHSMGGLVARYALRTMEKNKVPHETTTYVSFDSPHLGANVPLGALYFIQQVLSFVHGYESMTNLAELVTLGQLSEAEQILYDVMYAPSVRQLLVSHLSPSGQLDNSKHNEWQNILYSMGFPSGDIGSSIQNLSIVLGGTNTPPNLVNNEYYMQMSAYATSGLFMDLGTILLKPISLSVGFFAYLGGLNYLSQTLILPGNSNINFSAHIKPLSLSNQNKELSKLEVSYTKNHLWCIKKVHSVFSSIKYAPSTTHLCYDSFPSSTYTFEKLNISNNNDESDDWLNGGFEYDIQTTDNIPFIPTASALNMFSGDLRKLTHSIFSRNYYYYPPTPNNQTPFDAYWLMSTAMPHTNYRTEIFDWVYDNASIVISGPDIVGTEGHFTVTGINNPSWSTSDSSIAEIDSTGKLTAKKNGVVDVIVTSPYSLGKLYSQRKQVAVGFPEITLRAEFENNVGYKVWTEYQSSDTEMFDKYNELLASGTLQYEWSFFDDDGNMTTEVTSENMYAFLPSEDDKITAVVRFVDSEGNKSDIKSTTINLRTPFDVNYRYVVVDSYQNTYFVKSNDTYEVGTPTEQFMATFRSIALNPTDNPLSTQLKQTYLKGNTCYLAYPYFKSYRYWMGTKLALQDKWTFTFFNSSEFLNLLNNALNNASGEERTISVFPMIICNTEKEQLQSVPFAIIYKPTFANN